MPRLLPRTARPSPRHPRHALITLTALATAIILTSAACSTGSDKTTTTPPETTTKSSGGPTTSQPEDPADPSTAPSPVKDGIRIEVLSSQPDRATGPDARIRVTPPTGSAPTDLRVKLAERDVTDQLTEVDGALEGVINGLVEGNNSVVASVANPTTDTAEPVTQRIRSWPLTGPMISGPQSSLVACTTEAAGLGKATDDQCSAATKVSWSYVSDAGELKPLEDPTARPDDLATASIEGKDVPMTVRLESGTVNRAIYEIATLDPSPGGRDTDQNDVSWNRHLIYRYGPGCATTFGQGTNTTPAAEPSLLADGYAVATASLTGGSAQCNDVVAAETTMMVKERFIEEFGRPDATIADSQQWGAATALLIVQNYPGLIDGVVAADPLPDVATMVGPITDCGLLNAFYRTTNGRTLSPDQRRAISGHASTKTCDDLEQIAATLIDPSVGCDEGVPAERLYTAGSNPTGLRCTYQDGAANQFGTDPATGHALRPLDNVGLQYGLAALNEGAITFEQFAELNTSIGGYDLDGAIIGEREAADPLAVQAAYETGRVTTGVGDQPKVPIIQVSNYDDENGSLSDHLRPFSIRDRLVRGQPAETAPGLRIWTRDPAVTDPKEATTEALGVASEWLRSIDADPSGGSRAETLRSTRPDAALDSCLPAGSSEPITATELYEDKGPCRDDYPVGGDPRIVAGAPRSDDVIKCQLKPIDPADYDAGLSQTQFERLLQVFPEGVCDWSQTGAGQTTPSMSDRSFGDVITPGELA